MPDKDLTEYLFQGSGGGGCFIAGTPVWTPSGPVPIETVREDQQVLAYTSDHKIVPSRVRATHFHPSHQILTLKYWGGQLGTTPNHWFYLEEFDAFEYASKLWIDAGLLDRNLRIRPVEELQYEVSRADVYNLQVELLHTYLVGPHGIVVHNGGGGKGGGGNPTEQDNDGFSRATIRIVELLSEGPIQGFVGDPRESTFLDDTPVRSNGTQNFTGYAVAWRAGTRDQTHLPGYGDEVASETSVGQDVTVSFPVTRQIVNRQIDAVRIRLAFQLQEFQDDGDITGAQVIVRIRVKEGNGPFVLRQQLTFNTRFQALKEFDYQYPVNNQGGAVDEFTIRVESSAPDDPDSKLQIISRFQSYTEVIQQKLSYPHSAIIGQQFAAEQFNSVPSRAYKIGGIRCRIPTNAVVTVDGGLNFSGPWNMQLYRPSQATSDPAWQLLELLTNERFGVGQRIKLEQVSLASLYEVSRHNNQFVPDGFGGTERRYLCNTVLQSTEDAHDHIQLFLNACNAFYYWGGSKIEFWQDRPATPVAQVTNANVTDGQFKYGSTDIRSRKSVCNVVWNDPDDKYQRAVEPVDNVIEAIDKYGIRDVDFTAPGCTSRGQAVRAGRRRIYSDLFETETVTFQMAVFGIKFRPGDVIEVFDWKKPNLRYAGLVLNGTTSQIGLDAPVVLPAGGIYRLQLTLPSGDNLVLEDRAIANGPGSHQTLSVVTPFSRAPVPGAVWSINVVSPQLFRVRGMRAESDNQALVEIVAGTYYDQKQNLVENGFALQPQELPVVIPAVVNPPRNVGLLDISVSEQIVLLGSWEEPVDAGGNRDLFVSAYRYQYRRGITGVWSDVSTVTTTSARIEGLIEGIYYLRVATVYINGKVSGWVESSAYIVTSANYYFNFVRPRSAIALF
ncbi:phage tail protein [Leptothoe sp. EHU-05/26/07-4]